MYNDYGEKMDPDPDIRSPRMRGQDPEFRHRWRAFWGRVAFGLALLIAFVILALVFQSGRDTDRAAWLSDRQNCRQGNVRVYQINMFGDSLRRFELEAAIAREATGDLEVARRYRELASQVTDLQYRNCKTLYPPRGSAKESDDPEGDNRFPSDFKGKEAP